MQVDTLLILTAVVKMAEKRKGKKRKEEFPSGKEEPEKPAKEEYAIAKWIRKNVPTKKTKFLNHNVEYFTAVKAVDALMTSPWVQAKEGEEPFFSTRVDVVEYLDIMLRHKFFHRAKKVPVSEAELKAKLKKKEGKKKPESGDDKPKKDDGESSHAEGEKKDSKGSSGTVLEERERKKRKIRLDMHMEQLFVDGLDAYVWIYDPIPVYYWFFGTLLVLGAIAICLFPLWPPSVRKGVYYLSIAAAGFLIFIIGLAALRLVVFCILWCLTLGNHHLWLFPNLTEDVGFLASFWPLYQYEYKGGGSGDKKSKKKKKDKDSDNEEENKDDEVENDDNKTEDERTTEIEDEPGEKPIEQSESESESSQKSQTGKDFEMVEKEEVESS